MIAVVQRVTAATVRADEQVVGRIDRGLLALVAVTSGDRLADAEYMADRLLHLRIFADEKGRMNLSVEDIVGSLLVVSQFTLAADTMRGRRPSFSAAAPPDEAEALFESLLELLRRGPVAVQTGEFAARMQIELVNDGPVTFIVNSHDKLGAPRARDAAAS